MSYPKFEYEVSGVKMRYGKRHLHIKVGDRVRIGNPKNSFETTVLEIDEQNNSARVVPVVNTYTEADPWVWLPNILEVCGN